MGDAVLSCLVLLPTRRVLYRLGMKEGYVVGTKASTLLPVGIA